MLEPQKGAQPAAPVFYTWVATADAFQRMLQALQGAARIAVDIEADSLYHYFDKVCLIQISTRDETFILDPLALHCLEPLGPILANQEIEKVLHAAGYDVFCLRRDYSFQIQNLFDTHLSAQLLGYEQLGLSALMEKLLGVAHSKGRQRDDWSHRPLEPEQLEYAAMDTHHLLELRDILEGQLLGKGRLDWACEEFHELLAASPPEREFDPDGFRRIKGSRDLTLRELAVLRALYLLRDGFARELDVPPFKVLNNSVLIDLARKPPLSPRSLYSRAGISYRVARRYSDDICAGIRDALRQDPSFLILPARGPWKPPSNDTKARIERLKKWRQRKGEELSLPVGVVFPGTLLETVAANPPANVDELRAFEGMRAWRVHEFGLEILDTVQQRS